MMFTLGLIVLLLGLQLERQKSPSLIIIGIANAMLFLGAVAMLCSGFLFVYDEIQRFKP